MICCGEDRLTNFCPDCGAELYAGVGDAIRKLMAKHEKQCRYWVESIKEELAATEDGSRRSELEARLSKRRKTHAKWLAWKEWVDRMIEIEKQSGNVRLP